MADKKTHLNQAAHNEAFAEAVSTMAYPDWRATGIFYAALHYLQAYFLSKRPPEYPESHGARAAAIDADRFLDPVRNDYRDLQDVSEAARYYGIKPTHDEIKNNVLPKLVAIKKQIRQYIV